MVATPEISVVMAACNEAGRISDGIECILKQTINDWELILIDDGSTDETSHVVDDYARRDDRIRVLHQENRGLTQALIRGCAMARGRFIARQDADDWSHPERLQRQRALLESDDRIGFVSCWTQYVGPRGEPLEVVKRPAEPALATRQLLTEREGPPAHGSIMLRRELYEEVGGYRGQFYFGQDADLWLRMGERAWIAYCPRVLYSYRRDPDSVSGAFFTMQKQFGEIGWACRQKRLQGDSEAPCLEAAQKLTDTHKQHVPASPQAATTVAMTYLIGSQLVKNNDPRALLYLRKVIQIRPWHWKAWLRLLQSRLIQSSSFLQRRVD